MIKLFFQASMAGFMGGLTSYLTLAFIVDGINQETFVGIMLQGLSAGIVGLFFIVVTYRAFNSPELQEIYKSFHSRIFKTDVIAPQ